MSATRNFTVKNVVRTCEAKKKVTSAVLDNLVIAEDQAIEFTRLFLQCGYLTPEALWEKFISMNTCQVELPLVMAYLSGYLAGETYESRLKKELGFSVAIRDGEAYASAALAGIAQMIERKGRTRLPSRVVSKVSEPEIKDGNPESNSSETTGFDDDQDGPEEEQYEQGTSEEEKQPEQDTSEEEESLEK